MRITPQILPAAQEHLQAIADLAGIIWRASYPEIISSEQIEYMLRTMYSLDRLSEEVLRLGIRYERLLNADELIGFASFGPTEELHTFKLHKIYLHPQWQGRGLGSLLLKHCEQEIQILGGSKLILAVNKRNSKAIKSYQRNGFAIAESVVVDIGGGFVMDDYVVAKQLTCSQRKSPASLPGWNDFKLF